MVAAGSAGAVGPGSWLYHCARGEGQLLSEDGASACPFCSQKEHKGQAPCVGAVGCMGDQAVAPGMGWGLQWGSHCPPRDGSWQKWCRGRSDMEQKQSI